MGNSQSNNKIYSAAADVGKLSADAGVIIGTPISLILVGLGIYFLAKKQGLGSVTTTATIINVGTGSITVTYKANKKVCTSTIMVDPSETYTKNSQITINYSSSDPCTPYIGKGTSSKVLGGILLGIGLFILLIIWVSYYLVHRSKALAAVEGGEAIGQGIGSILKNIF